MKIKPLEDLIIAIILAKHKINKTAAGRILSFCIEERKEPYLVNYIQENELNSQIKYSANTGMWHVKQSVLLEKIIREWTADGEVVALDPRMITEDIFFLWILLFARKTKKGVAIDTDLPDWTKKDIPFYFKNTFGIRLYEKGNSYYIKTYHSILIRADQVHRPAYEHLEYNYLLPEREVTHYRSKMQRKV